MDAGVCSGGDPAGAHPAAAPATGPYKELPVAAGAGERGGRLGESNEIAHQTHRALAAAAAQSLARLSLETVGVVKTRHDCPHITSSVCVSVCVSV